MLNVSQSTDHERRAEEDDLNQKASDNKEKRRGCAGIPLAY